MGQKARPAPVALMAPPEAETVAVGITQAADQEAVLLGLADQGLAAALAALPTGPRLHLPAATAAAVDEVRDSLIMDDV